MFFFGLPGVVPEFLIDKSASAVTSHGFTVTRSAKGLQLRARGGYGDILVPSPKGLVHFVLLTQDDAKNLWKVNDGQALLLTNADVFADGAETTLQQEENSAFQFSLFHASTKAGTRLPEQTPLFVRYQASVPPVSLEIVAHPTAAASVRAPLRNGPPIAWRTSTVPMAPDDQEFTRAARWNLTVRGDFKATQLADVLVRIQYQGDVARLKQDGHLLDDDFWNGNPWKTGLRSAGVDPSVSFDFEVLPFPAIFPMMLPAQAEISKRSNIRSNAILQSIRAIPRYSYTFASQAK